MSATLFTQAFGSLVTRELWKMWNPHLSLNHGARGLFHGPELPESVKVTILHRGASRSLQCKQKCHIHRDQDRETPRETSLLPLAPYMGVAVMGLKSDTVKGRASPWEDGPHGRLGLEAPGLRFPVARQVWLPQLSSPGHSFSTRLVHQSWKSGSEGLAQTSVLFHTSPQRLLRKEPGGELGVRWGWQPMGSQPASAAWQRKPHLLHLTCVLQLDLSVHVSFFCLSV